jgi:hypothetical protein
MNLIDVLKRIELRSNISVHTYISNKELSTTLKPTMTLILFRYLPSFLTQ